MASVGNFANIELPTNRECELLTPHRYPRYPGYKPKDCYLSHVPATLDNWLGECTRTRGLAMLDQLRITIVDKLIDKINW